MKFFFIAAALVAVSFLAGAAGYGFSNRVVHRGHLCTQQTDPADKDLAVWACADGSKYVRARSNVDLFITRNQGEAANGSTDLLLHGGESCPQISNPLHNSLHVRKCADGTAYVKGNKL